MTHGEGGEKGFTVHSCRTVHHTPLSYQGSGFCVFPRNLLSLFPPSLSLSSSSSLLYWLHRSVVCKAQCQLEVKCDPARGHVALKCVKFAVTFSDNVKNISNLLDPSPTPPTPRPTPRVHAPCVHSSPLPAPSHGQLDWHRSTGALFTVLIIRTDWICYSQDI